MARPAATARGDLAIGIDVGGTKIAAAIADAGGRLLAEFVRPTEAGRGGIVAEIEAIVARLLAEAQAEEAALRAIAVALPAAVAPEGSLALFQNISDPDFAAIGERLRRRFGAQILIENDVNLAAFGEARERGVPSLCFVSLGTGIGAGLVFGGALHRGARGMAGEIAWLPIGADPRDAVSLRDGALERTVGSRGLVARYGKLSGNAVADVAALFDRAAESDPAASTVLDEAAVLLARCILSIAIVADPQLFVLGGSIGVRAELIGRIRSELSRIVPVPIAVETSRSGPRAGVLGALAFAVDRVARCRHPSLGPGPRP